MANVKITDLVAYTNPVSTDVLAIVDVGADTTKKVSIADLLQNASSGTAAAPGIAFDGDNTGIYSPGANQIALATNGAGRLFIDGNGQVGIGTTSPSNLLSLAGSAPRLEITDTDTSGRFLIDCENSAGSVNLRVDQDNVVASSAFAVSVDGTERARIDGSGRLLVGTASSYGAYPARLQVQNNNGYSALFGKFASVPAGPDVEFFKGRGGSASVRGIVSSGDQLGQIVFSGDDGSTGGITGAAIATYVDGTPGANDMPGRLVFSTTADGASSPTPRVTIDNIGNTYFSSSGFTNRASAQATSGAGLKILAYSTAATVEAEFFALSTSTRYAVAFSNPNGIVGTISTNASATAYNTSSDYRLKENVVPLTGAADRLNQLQVHRFNFIADPSKTVDGFLAHEAQAVVPESVTGAKDEVDDEGNPVYQGIDQSKIVPLVVAALQEALAKIETLEQRLNDAGIA